MGSAGQPAESDFDSGTDTDTSSDDEVTASDYSDMPTYLTEEQLAQWLFLVYQLHKRRWRRFMKKPVRRARRMARRTLKGKGKGRSKGKGKRRRLHGRGILAFLASLTGPQHEETFSVPAETVGIHQVMVRDDEEIQRTLTVKPWSTTYATAHSISDAGDGRGRGPSIHLARTDSDI
eukprot:8246167-Pyramimonas_sp.AAC.1